MPFKILATGSSVVSKMIAALTLSHYFGQVVDTSQREQFSQSTDEIICKNTHTCIFLEQVHRLPCKSDSAPVASW